LRFVASGVPGKGRERVAAKPIARHGIRDKTNPRGPRREPASGRYTVSAVRAVSRRPA